MKGRLKSLKSSTVKKMKSGSVPQQFTQQMYDSTADFGVFMALLGLIGASFIGCIMIGIAIYLIVYNGTHSKQTEANVVHSKCNIYKTPKNKTHKDCNTTVKYNVNNKDYENIISTNNLFAKNSKVKIVYDPNNPNDSHMRTGMRKIIAYVLIALAVIIIFTAVIRYYIVKTYKVAAAATGVGEAASIIATPFQSSRPSIETGPSFDSFEPMQLVDSIESK